MDPCCKPWIAQSMADLPCWHASRANHAVHGQLNKFICPAIPAPLSSAIWSPFSPSAKGKGCLAKIFTTFCEVISEGSGEGCQTSGGWQRPLSIMAQNSVEEMARAVLAASTSAGQLLISEHAGFEAARGAYKRLALVLHPDKNAGLPVAAEAFKVVTAAFNQLQALHERRRSAAQLAVQPAEPEGHSRWEAFTGRCTARPAAQQHAAAGDAGQPSAAAPAGGAAKPSNRWGRPSGDYSKLLKPSSLGQPASAAGQHGQQENNQPAASPRADPKPSAAEQGFVAGIGVAPSVFYARRNDSWQEQQQPKQQSAPSLYSLWGGQAPFSLSQPGSGGSHPQTAAAAAPMQRQSPLQQMQQEQQPVQPSVATSRPAEGGSKWGSNKQALLGLLRGQPLQQPFPAASKGAEAAGAAAPKRRSGAGGGATKLGRQRQAQVLESSSDSEGMTPSCDQSGPASLDSKPCSSGSDSEVSSLSEPDDDAPERRGMQRPGQAQQQKEQQQEQQQQQQQQPVLKDDAATRLEAAVQQLQAGALLAAQGQGAAVIQAGRKRALEQHYGRRGSGRQKRGGGGKRGGGAMQAKLQLIAVSSKRVRK